MFAPPASSAYASAAGTGVRRPLLEEKRDFGLQALISNIRDPFLHDRSCAWARLATHDIDWELEIRKAV